MYTKRSTRPPDPEHTGTFAILNPPEPLTSFEKRAADAMRFRWAWTPTSPPGVYVNRHGHLIPHSGHDGSANSDVSSDIWSLLERTLSVDSAGSETTEPEDGRANSRSSVSEKLELPTRTNLNRSPALVASHEGTFNPEVFDGTFANIRKDLERLERRSLNPWYTIDITTKQNHQNYSKGEKVTTFRLIVDTGSNTTWVRGSPTCEIVSIIEPKSKSEPEAKSEREQGKSSELEQSKSSKPTQGKPSEEGKASEKGKASEQGKRTVLPDSEYVIAPYDSEQMRGKSCLLNDGTRRFLSVASRDHKIIKGSDVDGFVNYGIPSPDGPDAAILFSKDTVLREWTILRARNWGSPDGVCQSWSAPLTIEYDSMAVSIAGSYSMILSSVFDGLLGLGPLPYQSSFVAPGQKILRSVAQTPSSSFALKAGLPSVKPDDEEPEDTPAVVTYVMLRDSEAGSDLFSQESCIAWQQYPLIGDEPSARVFSEKIYVSPTSTLWLVVLKKIRIWTGIHLKSKGDESGHAPATEIDCGSQQFVLDTGAACSYFPMKLRNQLIDKLQLTRIASGDSWRKPYCVPLSADGTDRFSYRNSTMEWVFHSEGHAPVTVPTTVRPFLMDNNRDGVIWDLPSEDNPTTTAAQSPIGILGQNFFYVADVAFHTPDPSYGAGRRYIKIAGSSSHRTLPPTRSRAEVAYSSAKKDALPGRPN